MAMAVAAAVSGRAAREVVLVLVTVVVGQALLGWDNDLVDEAPDRAAERADKPLAAGTLDRGTLGFALACAVLLVVPLSLSSGITAGLCLPAVGLLVGLLGNRWSAARRCRGCRGRWRSRSTRRTSPTAGGAAARRVTRRRSR